MDVPDDGPNEFVATQSAAFFGAEEPHVEEPLHVAHYAQTPRGGEQKKNPKTKMNITINKVKW
jgi:hypothetical protein